MKGLGANELLTLSQFLGFWLKFSYENNIRLKKMCLNSC